MLTVIKTRCPLEVHIDHDDLMFFGPKLESNFHEKKEPGKISNKVEGENLDLCL